MNCNEERRAGDDPSVGEDIYDYFPEADGPTSRQESL